MNQTELTAVLRKYKNGEITENDIIDHLKSFSVENLEFAHVDHSRIIRKGFPEIIYCEGKTDKQIKAIAESILKRTKIILATRASKKTFDFLNKSIPGLKYFSEARIITTKKTLSSKSKNAGEVVVVTAGTSDIPVAEEAAVTIKVLGGKVTSINDVGVAGLHRVVKYLNKLQKARVIIVIAGMDGALPSVIGGLVNKPIIAVPTSVGYGASFGGLSALLAMLNSCASGVTVVNIDNGFGAGVAAALIIQSE